MRNAEIEVFQSAKAFESRYIIGFWVVIPSICAKKKPEKTGSIKQLYLLRHPLGNSTE